MCAINGITTPNIDVVRRMNESTKHRGPDASNVWSDGQISLGHNRLKIIDLSDAASQPMTSTDGRYTVVFNGEIYNFKELKKQMRYPFRSESDTEVLLAGFIEHGPNILNTLNGIFAFAVWDSLEKSLFLARDHNGIKPLYYTIHDGSLIFSSEIKGILEVPSVRRVLSIEAFAHHLQLQYTPEPLTLFQNIYKLPAGHFGIYRNNQLQITQYWAPTLPTSQNSPSRDSVRKVIQQAVESELVSDRPVGLYLSGGIDSSTILHFMRPNIEQLNTFSVRFALSEDEQSTKFNRDADLAQMLAQRYGTQHHEAIVHSADIVRHIDNVLWHLEEPISNAIIVPMFILSGIASRTVTVALSGEGGDELFGGYDRYRFCRIANAIQHTPAIARNILNSTKFYKLNTPNGIERYTSLMFQGTGVWESLVHHHIPLASTKILFNAKYFKNQDTDSIRQFMEIDRRTWLTDEALLRSDKMSMAHGLEMRVPLLERAVINFARSIHSSQHVGLFETKRLLRHAMKGLLPNEILQQPKRGWFSPTAKWMRHAELQQQMLETFSTSFHSETGHLFNWEQVKQLLGAHTNKTGYHLHTIWTIFAFQMWAKRFNITLSL